MTAKVKRQALLKKKVTSRHPVDQVYGILKLLRRTDDLIDAMRGPRPKA